MEVSWGSVGGLSGSIGGLSGSVGGLSGTVEGLLEVCQGLLEVCQGLLEVCQRSVEVCQKGLSTDLLRSVTDFLEQPGNLRIIILKKAYMRKIEPLLVSSVLSSSSTHIFL